MTAKRKVTAGEIAELVGGTLRGAATQSVSGIAPLDEAGVDDLSWLGSAAYLKKLQTSQAGVVLVPADCPLDEGRTAVLVGDPDAALCTVLEHLGGSVPTIPVGQHPSAIVEAGAEVDGVGIGAHVYVGPGAIVGPRTQLHPGVYIGAGARLGADCVLWPNVVIRDACELGTRVIVHPNVTIGADGFGYLQRDGEHVKIPQIGRVVIEDDVEIGAGTTIDRARSGETRIGRGTKIDNLVQIGHNVCVGEHCIIIGQCGISGSCTLGDHVVLAGQVGVADHADIGSGAVVAAKSGIPHSVPAGMVVRGIPAVDNRDFGRQTVALRRLPKMIEQMRELVKRIERLESAKDDKA